MLTNVLRTIINNLFKKSFYRKRKKKKVTNILIAFSIVHKISIFLKSDVKIFLKSIVNHCFKNTL